MNAYTITVLIAYVLLLQFTTKLKLPGNIVGSAILAIAWPAVLVALFLLLIKVRVLKLPLKHSLRDIGVALLAGIAAMGLGFWWLGYFDRL